MKYWILSMAALLALSVSCSVKEDRTNCACLLVLDMSQCSNAPENIRIDLRTSGEWIEQDIVPGQDTPFYEYPVTKGVCSLTAYLCPRELSSGAEQITVEPGENCPEIYASRSVFEASGETAEHRVILHRQSMTVTLDMEDSFWDDDACIITVKGGVNGISLSSLKPIEGPFLYQLPPGERSFRLPRQTSESTASLILELAFPGGRAQVFDLGEYLLEAGYDWEMEDLKDVVVKISNSDIEVEISSSDWIIHSDQVIEI